MAVVAKAPGKAPGKSGLAHTESSFISDDSTGGEVKCQPLCQGFCLRGTVREEFHVVSSFL
jgi:hypothetical protein